MSTNFNFLDKPVTSRDTRKAQCGTVWRTINPHTGQLVTRTMACRVFQGPDSCPSCRRDRILIERQNIALGKKLYVYHYPSSRNWKSDRKRLNRHNLRYRWCYQGLADDRWLVVDGLDSSIPDAVLTNPSDINIDEIMNRIPSGSGFYGTLRVPTAPKEKLPTISRQLYLVKASPQVKVAAWKLAMMETINARPETLDEIQIAVIKRQASYKKHLIALGGKVTETRTRQVGVHLAAINWSKNNLKWTQKSGSHIANPLYLPPLTSSNRLVLT